MRDFMLYLVHLYRRWQLAHARQFAANLERTIENERRRARDAVNEAETLEARAAIAAGRTARSGA